MDGGRRVSAALPCKGQGVNQFLAETRSSCSAPSPATIKIALGGTKTLKAGKGQRQSLSAWRRRVLLSFSQ